MDPIKVYQESRCLKRMLVIKSPASVVKILTIYQKLNLVKKTRLSVRARAEEAGLRVLSPESHATAPSVLSRCVTCKRVTCQVGFGHVRYRP